MLEYPDQQLNDILDYVFKPKSGIGFNHLKIGLGSDANSSSGTAPSHKRSGTEVGASRCMLLKFAQRAKEINPNLKLHALRWGTPAWVTNDSLKLTYYRTLSILIPIDNTE